MVVVAGSPRQRVIACIFRGSVAVNVGTKRTHHVRTYASWPFWPLRCQCEAVQCIDLPFEVISDDLM